MSQIRSPTTLHLLLSSLHSNLLLQQTIEFISVSIVKALCESPLWFNMCLVYALHCCQWSGPLISSSQQVTNPLWSRVIADILQSHSCVWQRVVCSIVSEMNKPAASLLCPIVLCAHRCKRRRRSDKLTRQPLAVNPP